MQQETHQNRTLSEGYSLGMVKMEAFDDSHFMHQAVRLGHTDHTGSIVFPWHASLMLKRNFYVTGNSLNSYTIGGL